MWLTAASRWRLTRLLVEGAGLGSGRQRLRVEHAREVDHGPARSEDWPARWIGWDGGEETDDAFASLKDASWIWYPGGKPTIGAPIGTRYFRRTVSLPEGRRVRKALLLATADDSFVAYRQRPVGRQRPELGRGQALRRDRQLRPGAQHARRRRHQLTLPNVGPEKNPAGLIGLLKVEFEEGEPLLVPTDAHWRTGDKEVAGWEQDGFDDAGWKERPESGTLGTAPGARSAGSNHRRLPARMLRREFRVAKETSVGPPPTSAASASSTSI